MSTALAYDPVRRPSAMLPAPLQPAPTPAAAPRRAAAPAAAPVARTRVLAASALVGLAACFVGAQLVLSIGTAQSAYTLASLQQRSDVLTRQQQSQQEALRSLAAPQRLAAKAAALGMVPDDSPAYLDARTGKVLGSVDTTEGDASAPGGITR